MRDNACSREQQYCKPVNIFIAQVLNSVFRYGKVPEMFKMGYITPIYKKQGKPLFDLILIEE